MTDNSCKIYTKLAKAAEEMKIRKDKVSTEKNVSSLFWPQERGNLSLGFVDEPSPILNMSVIPASSFENLIIEDLLLCFIGCHGEFIVANPSSNRYEMREFKINPNIDTQISNLALKQLKLASYYSIIVEFIQENRLIACGRINQALSAAMDVVINEYLEFVAQLEWQKDKNSLNLHMMWYQIQPALKMLCILSRIVLEIERQHARGGHTLSILHEMTTNSVPETSHEQIYLFLMKKACKPYFESVQKWVFSGIIFDPYDEFMIQSNIRMKSVYDHYADYWCKRYIIRNKLVPVFLSSVSDEILNAGKYLDAIRHCVSENVEQYMPANQNIEYSSNTDLYLDAIHRGYEFASKRLLEILYNQFDIIDRIKSVKRYFLLEQGDFVVQIFDICDEELSQNICDIIPSRFSTLVDIALKLPSTNDDPYRDDIELCLKPQSLTYQIFKILSISTDQEADYKAADKNLTLTGIESFAINIKCKWPISLIFNHKMISCYQMLFRHLIYSKYLERQLSLIWLRDMELFKQNKNSSGHQKCFMLRHKMILFIQNMSDYMMQEVIEPYWAYFMQNISNCQSIDDFLKIHFEFIDRCINDCLLTRSELLKIYLVLLNVCKEFIEFTKILNLRNDTNLNNFEHQINAICSEFNKQFEIFLKLVSELSVADVSDKLVNIIYRLDNF